MMSQGAPERTTWQHLFVGPDDGHTFRIAVTSRMSSKVEGDEHHADADHFGPPLLVEVRAWNLPAALRQAAEVPLAGWRHTDDVPLRNMWTARGLLRSILLAAHDGEDLELCVREGVELLNLVRDLGSKIGPGVEA